MNSILNEEKSEANKTSEKAFTTLGLGDGAPQPGDYGRPEVPTSLAEAVRMSGLAYSAALTLFASVVFMLLLGWFVDLIAGSAPFGVIGGIILGSIIGFVQFFRIAGRIFPK